MKSKLFSTEPTRIADEPVSFQCSVVCDHRQSALVQFMIRWEADMIIEQKVNKIHVKTVTSSDTLNLL